MLENKYNYGTLNLESKDILEKEKFKYKNLNYRVKCKGHSNIEDPVLALKAKTEYIKAEFTKTKAFGPGKGGDRSCKTTKRIKNNYKNGKLLKETYGKNYH